jgi:hypothetical protein
MLTVESPGGRRGVTTRGGGGSCFSLFFVVMVVIPPPCHSRHEVVPSENASIGNLAEGLGRIPTKSMWE